MSQSSQEPESEFIDSLIRRHQESTADHLDRRMKDARTIKDVEEASSQRRLDEMWAREGERQRAIAHASAEQQRRDKQLMQYVMLGAALIIILVLVAAVVLAVLS
jgi:type VI protein secretion system component VasF